MAAYVKITYGVSSTTIPSLVARYTRFSGGGYIDDWIDHVTIGSSGGTSITIEPYDDGVHTVNYYAYTFPSTGSQVLYFFSKTTSIPTEAFAAVGDRGYTSANIISIDCSQANNDIASIGESTFGNLHYLQSVNLSDNITTIGRNAFEACEELTTINIPEGLSTIPAQMLSRCYSLQHITIPDNVSRINDGAFSSCENLEDVYIGTGLTYVGVAVFHYCPKLTSITATSLNDITYSSYNPDYAFNGIASGGTLYYPGTREDTYGPASGWLSTDAYWLGYYGWNGVATGSSIYLNPSAMTICANTIYIYASIHTSGCDMYYGNESGADNYSYTVRGDLPIYRGDRIRKTTDGYNVILYMSSPNTGATDRSGYIDFVFHDTSGNTYYDTLSVTQPAAPWIGVSPTFFEVSSAATSVTATITPYNCELGEVTVNRTDSQGTWDTNPVSGLSGNIITFDIPENPAGNDERDCGWLFIFQDTSGNSYTPLWVDIYQSAGTTPNVYIDPSSGTISYYSTTRNVYAYYTGCDIINSATSAISAYTYSISGDSFVTGITTVKQTSTDISKGRAQLRLSLSPNTDPTEKECYITFNFQDTSGNSYSDVFHLVQEKALALQLTPNNRLVESADTSAQFTLSAINCTLTSYTFAFQELNSATPLISEVTVERNGDYFIFHFNANPTSYRRGVKAAYSFSGEYGDGSYSYTQNSWVNIEQKAGPPRNISANLSDESVGSGSTTLSGTISTTSCTFDHLTYMTGGSMNVTVTTSGNTLWLVVPANDTQNSRVGYVYITFYDTDGNQFSQTITVRQTAGQAPPTPPSGSVLSSLTVSDNEQHRLFIEARPGAAYSACGIAYKTVPACEARYALYYTNSYGGVDVMVFKGPANKKTDNVTRFNYSRSFRNNTLQYENVNYLNEVKAVWELQTGWMTDEQSSRMHELVESTCVYLYDALKHIYTPVVMADKNLEYKTRMNQKKKLYNYTVKIEESQSKERR